MYAFQRRLSTEVATLENLDRISFGTFEVDLRTGELWKAGFRVRLAGQPFKVLVALLDHPGKVVTREDLQNQIWGTNTNVDFERAVSGAINKVREALSDSADNPRFIETLPKRGYRFIAPVTMMVAAAPLRRPTPVEGSIPASFVVPATPVLQGSADLENEEPPARVTGAELGISPTLLGDIARPTIKHRATLADLSSAFHASWIFPATVALTFLAIGLVTGWQSHRPVQISPLQVRQVTHYVPISVGPPNAESFLTLAQDGDRIITSVLENGRSHLSSIIASTGEVQRITIPDEVASGNLADISRDGTRLLVRSGASSASEQPLWIVPSAGGSGQRVGNILAHDATWMPDGVSILYASENDLTVFRPDDSAPVPFAKLGGRAFWLRWSPNGKVLRFTVINPVTHATSIWEVGSEGGQPRPVKNLEAVHLPVCCGVWTGDGSTFVFQANDNIWSIQGNGTGARPVPLTSGPLRYQSPTAAHNGFRVYFVGLESPSGLQKFNEKQHDFEASRPFLADANRVEYSRDGVWVAWTDIYEKLWRARAADGSDKLRLTSDATEVFLAHWAPDGKHLAVMARDHGSPWQTYIVDAAGGRPEAPVKETRNTADPSWSADGRRLVYGREPDLMGKESGPRNLQILDLMTHQTEVVPNSEGLFSPRWSPDGAWIVALSLDQKTLMLFDTKLRSWRVLASTSAADPVWSSDSKAVYIHAFLAEGEPILRVSVPEGTVRKVADLSSLKNKQAANYFFGGLTLDNEPLVQPRVGTGNLYSLDLNQRDR